MKTVHIISHSHWDREWYTSFDKQRVRLLTLLDDAMDLFESDPTFQHFHLDGQAVVLEDYLALKPEQRERLLQHTKAGHFGVGPWYVLQDEFYTCPEANIRNLQTGIATAKALGALCPVGYFPDAFGNAGQMPQILKQAGMKAVAFGRGVRSVGADNQTLGGAYESPYSEMQWSAPDGSALLGILFANWYNNGVEIPVEREAAKAFWAKRLADTERFAATDQLLLMNGCDHQPVQKDLTAALETARALYPDINFIQSDFVTYVNAVQADLASRGTPLATVQGELTSQETDGRWTLVNCASSRVDLKVKNRHCEAALVQGAEPLAVLAGKTPSQAELLRFAWKTLMQNHPHDSICCCSVDEVGREMHTRFDQSMEVATQLRLAAQATIAAKINTECGQGDIPIIVFNTSGWARSGLAETTIDLCRSAEGGLPAAHDALALLPFGSYRVKTADGKAVCATVRDAGVGFGYTLPDDKFRQPYMARQAAVTLAAEDIPPLGYKVYYLEALAAGAAAESKTEPGLATGARCMENARLKVELAANGSYTITEKVTGRRYAGLGVFEDTGDIGNEYIYYQPRGTESITTKDLPAEIQLKENTPLRAVFEVTHRLHIPAGADATLQQERARMTVPYDRTAGRSTESTELVLVTTLTLEKDGCGVKAHTTIHNTAKDHRVRVLFPTGLAAETHQVDSVFEMVQRPNRHGKSWTNPSCCEHEQRYVAMEDENGGLLAANIGLYEYEILPEQNNTIAVTLLRAVGEMGDWGVFPTPDAQLQGSYSLEYEIVPFAPGTLAATRKEAAQFQAPLYTAQTDLHPGTLPAEYGMLRWNGADVELTGFKPAADGNGVIARFVSYSRQAGTLCLAAAPWYTAAQKCNVLEEPLSTLPLTAEGVQIPIGAGEILTVRLLG